MNNNNVSKFSLFGGVQEREGSSDDSDNNSKRRGEVSNNPFVTNNLANIVKKM